MRVIKYFQSYLTRPAYKFAFFVGKGIVLVQGNLNEYERIRDRFGVGDGFILHEGILYEFSRDEFRPGTAKLGAAFGEVE